MGKKLKLIALAVLVAVIAYIYPTAKRKYVKHVKPRVEYAVKFAKTLANLKILGKPVPWKFVLPVVGVLLALLYVRVSKIPRLNFSCSQNISRISNAMDCFNLPAYP